MYRTVVIGDNICFRSDKKLPIFDKLKKIGVEDRRAIELSQTSQISKKENETKFQCIIINERRSIRPVSNVVLLPC